MLSLIYLEDLRRSVRALLARPGFTLAVVLTLALGLGANIAVFSAIQGLLLRPLPYPDSERLVWIYNTYPKMGQEDAGTTAADYLDRRDQAHALADSALFYDYSFDLADQGAPQRVSGVVATPSLFTTLGVGAQLGRTFDANDALPSGDRSAMWVPAQRVVLLSDALWRNSFNADPTLVGRDIRISGQPYRVIGVMPSTFAFPRRDVALWLPFAISDKQKSDAMRGFEFGQSIGRLTPDATIEQLNSQFDVIVARNLERLGSADAATGAGFRQRVLSTGFTGRARGLHGQLVGDIAATLWLLQAAVALVLAIACANVANLMLIRLHARQRELALRAALGATRRRVASQQVVESLVLATAGGAVGIAVAFACIEWVRSLGLDGHARGFTIGLDLPVLAVALFLAMATGAVCGLVPVLSLARGQGWQALKEGTHGSLGGRSARFARSTMVVVQLALAVALLVGAGLLIHSFWKLQRQDPGFDRDQVLSVSLNLSRDRYPDPVQTRAFQERLLAAVRALPGVTSAGSISGLPFSNDNDSSAYFIEGRDDTGEAASAYLQSVDEGLFRTMGMELLAGRDFLPSDDQNAVPVVIIDEALARKQFGEGSALGHRLGTRGVNGMDWRSIVGVVASIKRHRLSETGGGETYYLPSRQSTTRIFRIAIRSELEVGVLAGSVRAAIAKIDPEQPIWDAMTMRERISRSLDERRAPMLLLLLFAGVALALGAVGTYGVLAFAVSQRTSEFGVRMSLGANRADILRLVLSDGGRLVAIGIALGAALALALGQGLRAHLFGVEVVDPATLAVVLALVAVIALLAILVPAIRAANTSPTQALRYE